MAPDTLRARSGSGNGNGMRIPADVAAAAARAIAEGPRVEVEAPAVALGLLEEIAVEAGVGMARLASGEATTGTSSLKKIRDLARDALRLSRDTAAS